MEDKSIFIPHKRNDVLLHNLHREVVKINNKFYKTSSVIFHHGNDIESGHYTNKVFNNGSWFNVSDELIEKNVNWWNYAENAYIIFLERCLDHDSTIAVNGKHRKLSFISVTDTNSSSNLQFKEAVTATTS